MSSRASSTLTLLRRAVVLTAAIAALVVSASSVIPATPRLAATNLPDRLTNQEFWRLSQSFSEPGGTFHSDNFVSNEGQFQAVIPDLVRRARQGGLYLGVGPEQNFTYIAALEPRMAFIVDIRRGNLQQHLLYKALFEMSATRAEFLARLFSRERPQALSDAASPEELFAAFGRQPASDARYRANLRDVIDWLTTKRALPLSEEDRAGIDYIYQMAFYTDGPDLNYQLTGRGGGRGRGTPTYAELMATDDGNGRQRSYLASERLFASVKALHENNLIVPVVGDFAGPKALRAVGAYAREHDALVAAFYLSNVEQYLRQDGKWEAFCVNVAALPLDDTSTFIRSVRGAGGMRSSAGPYTMFTSSLANMRADTAMCAGR